MYLSDLTVELKIKKIFHNRICVIQSTVYFPVYSLQSITTAGVYSLRHMVTRVRMPMQHPATLSILQSLEVLHITDSFLQTLNCNRRPTQRFLAMGVKGLWELLAPCGRRCYRTQEIKMRYTIELNMRITCHRYLYIYQGSQSKLWTEKSSLLMLLYG